MHYCSASRGALCLARRQNAWLFLLECTDSYRLEYIFLASVPKIPEFDVAARARRDAPYIQPPTLFFPLSRKCIPRLPARVPYIYTTRVYDQPPALIQILFAQFLIMPFPFIFCPPSIAVENLRFVLPYIRFSDIAFDLFFNFTMHTRILSVIVFFFLGVSTC